MKSIQTAFPDVEIDCHAAYFRTGLIEVSWINGDKKKKVWSKGRSETD